MNCTRYLAACTVLLSISSFANAVVVSFPLTLSPVTNEVNRFDFEVEAFGVSPSDTTDLSGSVDAQLDLSLSPNGATATGIRFDGGSINASDIDLDFRLFVTVATIDGRNLGGDVITPGVGFSTITSGTFPLQDHTVRFNRGTLTGTGFAGGVNINLAQSPIELPLDMGTANISLAEVGANGSMRTYQTTVTIPVDATEALNNPTGTIDVSGTVVATGTFDVTLPLPGDYNNDGMVNLADYTVWRDSVGAPAGTLPNDVDGGVIGGSQYNTWKQSFGDSSSAGALLAVDAVPEPASCVAILAACVLAIARRRY